jgi:hypothetical protein
LALAVLEAEQSTTPFNELLHNVCQAGFEPKGVGEILALIQYCNKNIDEVSLIDEIEDHKDYRKIHAMMEMWELAGPPDDDEEDRAEAAEAQVAADDDAQRKATKKKREAAASSVEPLPKRQRVANTTDERITEILGITIGQIGTIADWSVASVRRIAKLETTVELLRNVVGMLLGGRAGGVLRNAAN